MTVDVFSYKLKRINKSSIQWIKYLIFVYHVIADQFIQLTCGTADKDKESEDDEENDGQDDGVGVAVEPGKI